MRKDLSFFVNISITRFSGPINHAFHKNRIYTFFCNGDLQQKYCEGKQKPLFPCGKRGKCYPVTSGSAMIAYFYLKGACLGILDASYAEVGAKIFASICKRYLTETEGKLNLGGICLVAGLGPENNRRRDGSYEYYISEPIVENDAKGLAPFLMCYTELLQSGRSEEILAAL